MAQPWGSPPTPSLGFRDVQKAFALPPLKDGGKGPLAATAANLQVITRARRLGLTARSGEEAWNGAGDLYADAKARVDALKAGGTAEIFSGATTSELNQLIQTPRGLNVRVNSDRLLVDEPIKLDRPGARLDLGHARLASSGGKSPYMVRIEGAQDVALQGGIFSGPQDGVLVSGSRAVTILGAGFTDLAGNGVLVTNSRDVIVWGTHSTRLGRATVLLHGATTHSVVAENEITGNLGASNWNAGVVLTDRSVDLVSNPLNLFHDDHYWVLEEPIPHRTSIPTHNLVVFNVISRNRASGVYVDGAAQNVITSNIIEGNAKEGLCLDNGSTANVVAVNTVRQNGKRWGSSDDDLKRDFVLGFGRLPDGSAQAKVPGISIDNALYNLVFGNNVQDNFGGGIKLVRSDYFNIIGMNTLVNNNEGRSEKFHFFGVELGAAPADGPAPDLDFTPSRGNIIFANIIRGSHYAGVFFAPGSDNNDIFDNSIFGATDWAMESVHRENNATLNNLTNQPSRNVDPGIDAKLTSLSAGRFDDPR